MPFTFYTWLSTCYSWNVFSPLMFSPFCQAGKKCLFKDNVSIRFSFRLLVLAWPQSNLFTTSVLLSHFGCVNRADALWFRTRFESLGSCAAVSLLLAAPTSGSVCKWLITLSWLPAALITLWLCKRADHCETSPKSGERCQRFLMLQPPDAKTRTTKLCKWKWMLGDCLFLSFLFY